MVSIEHTLVRGLGRKKDRPIRHEIRPTLFCSNGNRDFDNEAATSSRSLTKSAANSAVPSRAKDQVGCVRYASSSLSTAQLKISTRKGRFDNQQQEAARVRVNDGVARAQIRASLVIRCILVRCARHRRRAGRDGDREAGRSHRSGRGGRGPARSCVELTINQPPVA